MKLSYIGSAARFFEMEEVHALETLGCEYP